MMLKKNYVYLLLISMLIVSSCSNGENDTSDQPEEQSEGSSFPVTVEMDDENITIDEEPEDILPLTLELAEIVLELVEPSRVTATTKGIDDPYLSTHSEISDEVPDRIEAASNIDPEEIIAYDTDLLLLTTMYGEQEDAENTLSKLDTPILSFETMVTVEQFMEAMALVGEAIGEKVKADDIVSEMKTEITSIQESIPENEDPSVLILSEVGGDMGPLMMGPTNISYDLIHLAEATPAVDSVDLERSTPATIEQILKMDPDYILLLDFFGKGEEGFEELINDPGWETLEAVEEEQVKIVEAKYILNPNVANVEGLKIIVDWIYDLKDESDV